MKKYLVFSFVLALVVGLSASLALAQTTGSVKGVCKDLEGKPIAGAQVQWTGTDTGRTYNIKTNNKGEYFSLGISPGKYNVKLVQGWQGNCFISTASRLAWTSSL